MISKYKIAISIFIIWLFNISGILGILSSNSDWFLKLTPINLSMYVILIIWNVKDVSKKFLLAFFIPFLIGFTTEYLGVNYGLIFGSYSYGGNLGIKLGGVPLMICVNWAVLTIITADLSSLLHKNTVIQSLIGGFIMILIEKKLTIKTKTNVDQITKKQALIVGFAQCFALIPGVSRSASTIMGGLISGLDRKTATEFSFFLAIPIIFAASLFDLASNFSVLNIQHVPIFFIGFITAFISAFLIIKVFIRYVANHDFVMFGWYRIVVGLIAVIYFF